MKLKKIFQLNPFFVKLISTMTLIIGAFYFHNLSGYSLFLKSIALLILVVNIFLEAIKTPVRKEKDNAVILVFLTIILCLTERLNEALFLLFTEMILLYLKQFSKEISTEFVDKTLEEEQNKLQDQIIKKQKKYEKSKRKILLILGLFLIFIPNFITQKFELHLIYIGTFFLIFITEESMIQNLYMLKEKMIHNLFQNNIGTTEYSKLRKLKQVKTILFEKTETLTLGDLRVIKVNTKDEEQFLKYLNAVEYHSEHLIAKTIKKYKEIKLKSKKIKDFEEIAGRGVKCKFEDKVIVAGNIYFLKENGIHPKKEQILGTIIYLAVNDTYLGYIVLSDSIKQTFQTITDDLRKQGIQNICLLSGDNEQINKAVCQELKITDQYSNLTPDEKKFWIKHIKEQKKGDTLLIGNSTTSIKVLEEADTSLILSKNCKPQKKSDFYIMNQNLEKLPKIFEIYKRFQKYKYLIISLNILLKMIWTIFIILQVLPIYISVIIEKIKEQLIKNQIERRWKLYDRY